MAFKSDAHRRWYFANKKNGTLSFSSKSGGSKKRFYKKSRSSAVKPSLPPLPDYFY